MVRVIYEGFGRRVLTVRTEGAPEGAAKMVAKVCRGGAVPRYGVRAGAKKRRGVLCLVAADAEQIPRVACIRGSAVLFATGY